MYIHHPNYVKVLAVLVVLRILSSMSPMTCVRWLILGAAFGIAVIKAYLVAKNFMHVNFEKRWITYLLITCLAFLAILFAGVAPDVMKHWGLHWVNDAAKQAVASGMHLASPKHE